MTKKVITMISVLVISWGVLGSTAFGEHPGKGAGKSEGREHPRFFFQKMDTNQDGKISMEEWHQGWKKLFDLVDTNQDHFLVREEAKAFAEKIRTSGGNIEEKFARMDKNQDGKITQDEWIGPPGLFHNLDRNGDGAITKDEYPAPQKEDALARFKKMDANGDGKISKEEWKGPAELFNKIDANQDSSLTPEEFQEFHKKLKRDQTKTEPGVEHDIYAQFDRIDQNKDGKISPEELDAWAHQLFLKLDRNQDGVLEPSDMPLQGQGMPHPAGPRAGKHR